MGKKKKKAQKQKKDALANLPENVAGQAREIWLAGLGALDRARKDGGKQFDDLVKRGEKVRSKGSEAIDDVLDQIEQAGRVATGKAKSATKKAAGLAGAGVDRLESAVEAVMVRTGIPGREEVAALSDQVEALRARMAHLLGDGPTPTVYSLQPREDGWAVQKVGAKQASSTHGTKKEALVAARKLAKQHAPSRLVIHRADGTEQETVEYEG
ncbi:MAG: DUF2188 domain-containing protein [Rhodothermaceae bacterium]|nr:DUF2188 domain-containing protein [Rhodothermaceae bacterium]